MNDLSRFEARIAALIATYADGAPTEVDPIAMTRLAAGRARGWSVLGGLLPIGRGLGYAILLLALLVAILAGAFAAGGHGFRRDLEDILAKPARVGPFVGLPPEGASPSAPETGELVLSFYGRVATIGLEFHRMWVYADGRLIWKRNLDGVTAADRQAFGSIDPTPAVIEQRLTPEGVELLRRTAISAGLSEIEPPADIHGSRWDWGRPGVLWGGLAVQQGDGLVEAVWADSDLPGLLADPESWLPATAWEDQRLGAYVPSRYAVCISTGSEAEPSPAMELLPEAARDVVRSRAFEVGALERGRPLPGCLYQVTADDARLLAAIFAAGMRQDPRDNTLRYEAPGREDWVELLPILPDGGVVCNCG